MNRFTPSLLVLLLVFAFLLSSFFVSVGYAAEGSWYVRQQMPTARSGLGVAVVDGKIYAIGGNNYLTYYDVNEMYDPDSNTWVTKASMPTARSNFGIAVVDNKIYVIGGGETKINEAYDPQTDTWETKTPMNIGRSGLSANVVDGKIYVIGGNRGNPSRGVSATEVYDPETDTWSTAKQIPIAVTAHVSAVVDDKIYIIGGSLELTHNQIFDPKTNTWTTGASLPTGVDSAAAGVITDLSGKQNICVIGGKKNFDAVDFNQIYAPKSDTWSTGASMHVARLGLGAAVLDNSLHAVGGVLGFLPEPVVATNERYSISDSSLDALPWIPIAVTIIVGTAIIITGVIFYKKKLTKHN
jgi:N-acetylneuraminic acid mutarotase